LKIREKVMVVVEKRRNEKTQTRERSKVAARVKGKG
jgi:hypothetical protein